jgi:hypothetical protein
MRLLARESKRERERERERKAKSNQITADVPRIITLSYAIDLDYVTLERYQFRHGRQFLVGKVG